ncbi:hypothetical protein Tco_0658807 [Tanacetum coccineum]
MLAPGNYVQWKSIIKRYIDTKPNNELIHYCLQNPPYKFKWTDKTVLVAKGSSETTTERYIENYKNVSQDIRDQLNAEAEAVQIILTGIDDDIYSIVDACPNACEMWKAIERFKQGESINVQDHETNLYLEFGKFTSRDGKSLELYYSRFYKMINELVRNQCDVTNHQVNVQFLLQLQQEWKRLACTINPLALVAQQQQAYHPQNHPNHYTQNSLTKSQQTTLNIGKAIVNSSAPIYDQEPTTITEDDEMSKENEIDKRMALISLSFKKIYKPTNNNLLTSSNTSRANQDNSPRINRGTGYENQRVVNVARARKNVGTQKPKRAKDAAYHKEKMLLCKQEEARVQLNAEQADWKDDTDDESDDQELEAHYMYMAHIQEVTPDVVDNSGPIFDAEPLHKVQNSNDTYNVFAIENEHPEQPESVNDIYLEEQERDLLASLIEKLKCEIDDSKKRNKFLESSNQALVDKLEGEIEDFKTKNKSLESSNNHFKEANSELSKTNQLMFKDLKKLQAELDRYHDVNYASKVAIDCAKAKGDLMSYKIESKKSSNEYTRKINDLNQTNSDMKKELFAHQETISIMSQEKEAQINFAKPEFLKKAQRVNPCLYDIGCYNDNLALMLAPESDETIRLAKEIRSKLSNLIRPFDYDQLNNLYDLSVPQHFSKSTSVTKNNVSNDFSKPVTAQILPQHVKSILKNTNVIAPRMYKVHTKPNQTRTSQLPQDIRKTNKRVSFSTGVIPTTSVSRPQLKSNRMEDRVMPNNSQGKKQEVEDHRRNLKFSNNKTSITAYNDSLNAKISNVNFVCVTCGKCMLNDNHDMCVLHYINGINYRTRQPIVVPISTREPKRNVNQSVATSHKKTVAT